MTGAWNLYPKLDILKHRREFMLRLIFLSLLILFTGSRYDS